MDYADYKTKISVLLSDTFTYKEVPKFSTEDSKRLNHGMRKLLSGSTEGKKLQYLLEENPVAPSMYGPPKTS